MDAGYILWFNFTKWKKIKSEYNKFKINYIVYEILKEQVN